MSMNNGNSTPEERYRYLSTIYDEITPFDTDAEAAVSFLAKRAAGGRILELAVGTGRIAIPLAEHGCDITGVDASPDMLEKLRSKDPGGLVRTVHADMATLTMAGGFDLIYAVANSIFELHSQELQVSCIASAARLLRGGGSLVIEAAVPNYLFADRRPLFVGQCDALNTVTLQAMQYDQIGQTIQYRHVFVSNDGIKVFPTFHRFIYLPELDLMANLGGLRLAARYSDWTERSFNGDGRHISVYGKPEDVPPASG
jgi:SAM-dependent methyltransferase